MSSTTFGDDPKTTGILKHMEELIYN